MFFHRNIPAYVLLSAIRRALEPNISVIISLMAFTTLIKKLIKRKVIFIKKATDL